MANSGLGACAAHTPAARKQPFSRDFVRLRSGVESLFDR